LHFRN